ncbi:hypothetical protein SLA2020_451050 [Shorea laevis]
MAERKSAPLIVIPSWRPQSTRLSLKRSSESSKMSLEWPASVAPFGACFSSENNGSTSLGPATAVPEIDLVLQSESVYWSMFGSDSMVRVVMMWCVWGSWMEGQNQELRL